MSGTNRPSGQRPKSRPSTGKGPAKKTSGKKGSGKAAKPTGKALFKLWLRRLLILGVVGTLLLVAIAFFAYQATEIPDPNADFQTQTTNVYYAGGKDKLGQFATQNRESIPLADVPQTMQDAIISAEDRTFWTNKGIDPKGILRAAFSNAQGNATQGASTITQQYVKVLYLTQERTLKRKIKEAFLSLKVQQQQSKSTILEGYLNTIYFGRGAYGIEAASQAYFGIPAKKLNLSQSAMLAAVVNSPNYLNPDRNAAAREALLHRYQYVLRGMVSAGDIDQAQSDKVYERLPKRIKAEQDDQFGGQRGFMLSMVKSELLGLGFDEASIEGGGLKVTTTFTRKAMKAAKDAVLSQRPEGLKGLHVGTASVDVETGGVLGFYGGQDYLKSQLNWAKLGNAPGSAFKPFALAAGIKDGFSLKDTFDGNSPLEVGDIEIENEGEGGGTNYGSHVSLLKATEESINTAYVDMTQSMDDGPQKVVDMAVKLGIPRKAPGLEPNTTVSLGSATISLFDMANAYATIANEGVHHDWYVVDKVTRASDGKELYRAPRKKDRAISADLASDVSYALQQVVKAGTGSAARALGRPAAGKTGTATRTDGSVISSWFVGYTPQVATAVMYTRDNGRKPLNGWLVPFFGASYPARTWTALMQTMMDGKEVVDFPEPARLDGDAPSKGHAPYVPPPPDACPGIPGKQKPGTDCTPPDACPNMAGTQEPGTVCTTPEPVANGTCSDYGYPTDPDCEAPEPTANGTCSDYGFPADPDCTEPEPPTPTDSGSDTPEPGQKDGVCPVLNPNDPDCRRNSGRYDPTTVSSQDDRFDYRARPTEELVA